MPGSSCGREARGLSHHRKEHALNNGLIKFPGVILFASRDHQVVQTTANRIIEFLPDGTFVDKVSSYDEYLENDEMARKRQVYSMSDDDASDN